MVKSMDMVEGGLDVGRGNWAEVGERGVYLVGDVDPACQVVGDRAGLGWPQCQERASKFDGVGVLRVGRSGRSGYRGSCADAETLDPTSRCHGDISCG